MSRAIDTSTMKRARRIPSSNVRLLEARWALAEANSAHDADPNRTGCKKQCSPSRYFNIGRYEL